MNKYETFGRNFASFSEEPSAAAVPRDLNRKTRLKKQAQDVMRGLSSRLRGAATGSCRLVGHLGRHISSTANGTVRLQLNRWLYRMVEPYL
ncbi:uncharacterized protein CEXT_253431 [Caerostris extrusa]|uniref:Uncharacterized protein n=1 Tax=Caerostris extrusa TaxID=172846 RepID=A0AAV4N3H6_CAEEX|nr:uncharacterized protein CEXT_253431 [Caerostris extrusa]